MANEIYNPTHAPSIVRALYSRVVISSPAALWAVGHQIQGVTTAARAEILDLFEEAGNLVIRFKYIKTAQGDYQRFKNNEGIDDNDSTASVASYINLDVEPQDITDFSKIPNFPRESVARGGVNVKIKVLSGKFKFAIDEDPTEDHPLYTTGEQLEMLIKGGNKLTALANRGVSEFEISV